MNTETETETASAPVKDKERRVELVGGPRCGDTVIWTGAKTQKFKYDGGVCVYELESETKAVCRSS